MINWENVKTQSIENINDIVDDAGTVLLDGLTETKKATVDLQEQCQVNLTNYKMACEKTSTTVDSALVTKAETFIA